LDVPHTRKRALLEIVSLKLLYAEELKTAKLFESAYGSADTQNRQLIDTSKPAIN
jgi:hypothetical protein